MEFGLDYQPLFGKWAHAPRGTIPRKVEKYFVLKMDKGFIKHASHPDSYPVASYVYLG